MSTNAVTKRTRSLVRGAVPSPPRPRRSPAARGRATRLPLGDQVVVLDADADVVVALHRGAHLGDHRAVLRRVGKDLEQLPAHVDAGLDGEDVARLEGAGAVPGMGTIVDLEPDPVAEPVRHVEKRLGAGDRVVGALVGPRRIEGRVHPLGEAEPGHAARHHLARRVAPGLEGAAGPRRLLGRGLRVAHDLVDRALLGAEAAARGKGAGDVGGVAAEAGADVHHDHVALPDPAVVGVVVILGRVGARADDGDERRAVAAVPAERRLEHRLGLVLPHAGLQRPHDLAERPDRQVDRAAEHRLLGGTLPGAEAVEDRVRVAHRQARVPVGERRMKCAPRVSESVSAASAVAKSRRV